MTTEPLVRVIAQQRRSQATFDAILAAAGSLFDEVGIEATTMDAIARHAEVSIGTVYRFFENRDAIVATLASRWRERIQEAALPVFSDESLQRDAAAVITDFLAAFRRLLDELPGTRGLLAAVATEASQQEAVLWTSALDRFFQRYAPDSDQHAGATPPHTYQRVTIALMIGAAGAGQQLAAQLNETRSVLLGYTNQLATEARAKHTAR